jgi:hypothetical protein
MIRALLVINAILALHYAGAHMHQKNTVCFAGSTSCGKPSHSVVCFAQDTRCAQRALFAIDAVPAQGSPHP